MEPGQLNLSDMPTDLLAHEIFAKLDAKSLAQLMATAKPYPKMAKTAAERQCLKLANGDHKEASRWRRVGALDSSCMACAVAVACREYNASGERQRCKAAAEATSLVFKPIRPVLLLHVVCQGNMTAVTVTERCCS